MIPPYVHSNRTILFFLIHFYCHCTQINLLSRKKPSEAGKGPAVTVKQRFGDALTVSNRASGRYGDVFDRQGPGALHRSAGAHGDPQRRNQPFQTRVASAALLGGVLARPRFKS